jgi:TolB protein
VLALVGLPSLDRASRPAQPPPSPPPTFIVEAGVQRFAIPDCVPRRGDEASREVCRAVTQVLRGDLQFENLFKFVPQSLMSAIPTMDPEAPNFTDWKGVGASVLVVTRAQVIGGEATVEVRVHSVDTGQAMLAMRYSGRTDNPRIFAHQASDDIMTLTQYRGVARTKIAFVSDRDAVPGRKTKEIYIVDYDGYNPRRVTVNRSLNILPNWSPDGRSLAYVSYRRGNPDIFLAAIYEGRSTDLTGDKGGAAFAPSISPDGKRITFASSRSGNMDIWVVGADGSNPRRLTSTGSLDTAPTWSPTGQEIAFTSDRSGSPQIYVMDTEGLNVRRLTTVGNWNDAPAWNPSKQFSEIAYTARLESGGFDIAVVDIATRQVRQLTQGRGSCEYPSWAPNGRHLTFACGRGGKWQIAVADRLGQTITMLPAGPGKNEQPDWGP